MEKENLSPSDKLNKLKEVLFAHRKADKDEGEKEVVAQGGSNKNPEIQDGPKQELEAGEKKLISEDAVKAASKVPFKKQYYQGNYSGASRHIEKKYGKKVLNHPKVKDALRQANESKMATKDHDGDGKVESSKDEYMGSKDKAIKNALAKRKDKNEKAMKTGFMKMPEYAKKKFDEENIQEISADLINKVRLKRRINHDREYMDNYGHVSKKTKDKLERNRKLTFSAGARAADKLGKALSKHMNKSEEKIQGEATQKLQEISTALKKRYIAKANKQITSKEKMKDYQLSTMDKQNDKPKSLPREKFTKADKEFVKNKYDKEINKRRVGVRTARSKLQEISKNLASRYIKRAAGSAISNADKTQYHTSKMFQKQEKGDNKGAKKEYKAGRDPSRKTMNRFYGIQRAAGKLNKNDKDKGEYLGHSMTKQRTSSKIKATEEMVSELRKSTLSNYIKKAGKQYDDGENALHKGYPEKPIYKMQDKRAKGMAMAGKKLAKKITTSEEIQQRLDELKKRLDPKCWDGYKKQGTKKKGDTIVNNCVKEDSAARAAADARRDMKRDSKGLASTKKDTQKAYNPSKDKSPPHIISQLHKAVSLGDKHDGVKFKDGKTHKVSAKHAQGFINKYMSSKPADKERMQSHGHESHKNFKTHL